MAVESADDRAAFVSTDEFGVSATYVVAADGTEVAIAGLFDDPSAMMFSAPGMMGGEVTFRCRAGDLPDTAANGDQITIPGTSPATGGRWRVAKRESDGHGFVRLQLEQDD